MQLLDAMELVRNEQLYLNQVCNQGKANRANTLPPKFSKTF